MENNNNYTKLYNLTDKFNNRRIYDPIDDNELAELLLNRLMKKAKEEIIELMNSEEISSKTYALEALVSSDSLENFINDTWDDEPYRFSFELPTAAARYSDSEEVKRSAELFTKEYIDAFDADGELLKNAMDGVIACIKEALKKKTATDGVE